MKNTRLVEYVEASIAVKYHDKSWLRGNSKFVFYLTSA